MNEQSDALKPGDLKKHNVPNALGYPLLLARPGWISCVTRWSPETLKK